MFSFPDSLSPIVVRQFRRLVRSHTMTWTTLLYLALTIVAFGAGFAIVGIRTAPGMVNWWDMIGIGTASWFIGIVAILPALMYGSARINDELLDLAILPKKRLHGYMLLSLLWSGYYAALSLPFVSLAFMFGGGLTVMLGSLGTTILSGIVYHLLYLSFLNKVSSQAGLVVGVILLFTFGNMPFSLLALTEGALTAYLHFSRSGWGGGMPPPYGPHNPIIQVYIAVYCLVIGVLAYRLCRRHLSKPFRSIWKELGINLAAYGLTAFVFCAVWAGLRLGGVL